MNTRKFVSLASVLSLFVAAHVVFYAQACNKTPTELPKVPETVAEAVTIYNCIVDVQRESQKTISELCPVGPDAGPYEQLKCPALPMLLVELNEKLELCKGAAQ